MPEYLKTNEAPEVRNLMDYGVALGRRFRALKLWFVLRYFGTEGIANRLRSTCGWPGSSPLVDESEDFERLMPVPIVVVSATGHRGPTRRSSRR